MGRRYYGYAHFYKCFKLIGRYGNGTVPDLRDGAAKLSLGRKRHMLVRPG